MEKAPRDLLEGPQVFVHSGTQQWGRQQWEGEVVGFAGTESTEAS